MVGITRFLNTILGPHPIVFHLVLGYAPSTNRQSPVRITDPVLSAGNPKAGRHLPSAPLLL
jgi:hypothetical protein